MHHGTVSSKTRNKRCPERRYRTESLNFWIGFHLLNTHVLGLYNKFVTNKFIHAVKKLEQGIENMKIKIGEMEEERKKLQGMKNYIHTKIYSFLGT